jgi:hypothetical protein
MTKICYCLVYLPHIKVTYFNIGSAAAAAALGRWQTCSVIRHIQSIKHVQMLGILSETEMVR